ncbi:ankyrin repeat family A protein 2 [Frankliniella occidentalis]|uniref:Ankyrin repeat family A protein 2 n=1 Tax=Frankliniella occidentalis TaxID=133901 RepID=A0A6J1TGV2_FRAOC|nr:ankyrin repeat family A protein 2 [Frankliniella occidentalis]
MNNPSLHNTMDDEDDSSNEVDLTISAIGCQPTRRHSVPSTSKVVPKSEPLCDRDYGALVDVKPRPLPALRPEFHDIKNIQSSPAISWSGTNWQDGSRKSAFQPYRPSTLLTNLQRGNTQTQTPVIEKEEVSLHERAGQGEITEAELEQESKTDSPDENGLTPLMWAAAYGQLSTVQLFLKHGAQIDKLGPEGETPLLLAAAAGHHDVVRLLLNEGAAVNHADDIGNTAIMYAAHGDHPHCVNELLLQGADFSATNENGDTAYTMVVRSNSHLAQVVLENHLLTLLT